ncbi:homoserine acetyltransferase family protein [Coniochaeta ligniaria NRRL 30616]|uniref:Homoserine acetyltransferase family protein n=1 Tax=Coniochaeta ligniaria NRRL 30616 TaxID=1408157 RepID=A0A1J7ISI1_9PEZI|nr:homoserine acetyltransferase family protein [Coniochaeta ligniaria NRRL 30616]
MASSNGIVSKDDGPLKFHLGDYTLDSGVVLPGAYLAYKTFGDRQNPVILTPTWYAGSIDYCATNISTSSASLNPSKYYIIVPALIGNGESISPSNTPELRENFPVVTFADNVRAQHRLLTEGLGIDHVKVVAGWSMGGYQAYYWAVQYPDFMDAIVPICTSAKTSIHNNVFLEGVKSALIAPRGGLSQGIGKGQRYSSSGPWTPEQREVGLKALARVYAGWGFSQSFYRHKLYSEHFGAKDVDEFLVNFWEAWALGSDPDDLLVMLQTWQLGDISASPRFGGDFAKALGSIKAKALVAPGETDLYFPPEDSQFEVEHMAPGRGTLAVIPSIWGHWAGGPGDSKADWKFLDDKMAELFEGL